ncbi:MAG: hypothetical protein M3442_17935 [Chloroflexota bacterium]|nr:hypothetical protein [Chloroflexota bacterium]
MLLHRWWLPVGFAVLAAGAAYFFSAQATPTYRATAHLSVTPSIVDFFTGEAVQRLLNNYSLQLKSRSFAALAAQQLGTPGGAEQVLGKIKAVAAPAEYRISVEVDDPDPARAQAIANAAATAFVEKQRAENAGREKRDIEVQVLDLAERPGAPVSPRPRRSAAGAGILGAGVGVATALLLEYLNQRRPPLPGRATADATRRRIAQLRRRRGAKLRAAGTTAVPRSAPRTAEGVLAHGLRPHRPTGRGDRHEAALASGRGVPDTTH